jgi:hypothetical protein
MGQDHHWADHAALSSGIVDRARVASVVDVADTIAPMGKQAPDFTKIFFESLGGKPEAIAYSLRDGSTLLRDFAFVGSLVHDAHVLNPRPKTANGTFEVRHDRDCWELGFGQPGGNGKYRTVLSSLNFSGVRRVEWPRRSRKTTRHMLDHCWITRKYRAPNARRFAFELVGLAWVCRVRLARDQWSIELRDQATPRVRRPTPR